MLESGSPGCYACRSSDSSSVVSSTIPLKAIATTWSGWTGVQFLFTFLYNGDSYTSTLFNIYGQQPNHSNPLGNPPFPGCTSSNGPNWVDFWTSTYNESYIQTYNLAFGGAVVDSSLVEEIFPEEVKDLRQQVTEEFLPAYGDMTIAPWRSSNSLFAIFIGMNDVNGSFARQNSTLNVDIFKVYRRVVDQLYRSGARNFLFINVPPIDRSPGAISQGPSTQHLEAADVEDFNSRPEHLARNLSTTYADSTVFQFDTNRLFTDVLASPASHLQTAGYKNTTDYCVSYENGTPTMDYLNASCGVPVNQYL